MQRLSEPDDTSQPQASDDIASASASRDGKASPERWALVFDEADEDRRGLQMMLATRGYRATGAPSLEAAFLELKAKVYDLILVGVKGGCCPVTTLLDEFSVCAPDAAVVFVTDAESVSIASLAW